MTVILSGLTVGVTTIRIQAPTMAVCWTGEQPAKISDASLLRMPAVSQHHLTYGNKMPCQFDLGHSSMIDPVEGPHFVFTPGTKNSYGSHCQFDIFDERHMEVCDGKQYCPFHLPPQDPKGVTTSKGRGWDPMLQASMTGHLLQFVRVKAEAGDPVNLCGLQHWDRLTLDTNYFSEASFVDEQMLTIPSLVLAHAVFPRGISIQGVKVNGSLIARFANFGSQVNAENLQVVGHTDFSGAVFKDNAQFFRAKFDKLADFTGARFESHVSFPQANFGSDARFASRLLWDLPGVRGADDDNVDIPWRSATFFEAHFTGAGIFDDREFAAGPDFTRATFDIAPSFHNSTFHKSVSFNGATFNDKKSPQAEARYRTLKTAMDDLNARDLHSKFFSFELESRAQNPNTPRAVRYFSHIYEFATDYGENFVRPLGLLFLLTLLCTLTTDYFLILAFDAHSLPYIRVLTVTLEQVVRPFYVWQSDYLLKAFDMRVQREGWALIFQLTSTLQSTLSLGLLATSLLALRRRFKLD